MEKVNIFGRKVSVFEFITDKEPCNETTILEVLTDHECEDMIDKYRGTKKEEDKLALPVFTCSGIFLTRKNNGLDEHNGVICIDIDKKDNLDVENFDEIRSLMKQIPYVAYCGHSCGGEGYFVLMPIEDAEKHHQHYKSACDDFERCGITVDRKCINVSRTRFFSYDNEAYFNYEAFEYSRTKEEIVSNVRIRTTEDVKQSKGGVFKTNSILEQIDFDEIKRKVELIIMFIERDGIDITATYEDWYKVGAALANQFGENGREYFHRVSRFHPKYSKLQTSAKYHQCMNLKDISIGTFFHIAKKYDVYV
jgi:hypothetical protein